MQQNRPHAPSHGRLAADSKRGHAIHSNGDRGASRRLAIIGEVALFWVAAAFARPGHLQFIEHGEYVAGAHRQKKRVSETTPKRGAIYDRNLHALAMSIPV